MKWQIYNHLYAQLNGRTRPCASAAGKVASGNYASESEVICQGLSALCARERALEDWLRRLTAPACGASLADPTRGLSLEEVCASIGER